VSAVMKNFELDVEQESTLQLIQTEVFVAILNGQLDMVEVARKELMNRGRNAEGDWVGFEKSEELLGKPTKRRKKA